VSLSHETAMVNDLSPGTGFRTDRTPRHKLSHETATLNDLSPGTGFPRADGPLPNLSPGTATGASQG